MKKIVFLAMASMFIFATLNAQVTSSSAPEDNSTTSLFSKGDKVLNLGLGLGSTLYSGSSYSTVIPPISASLEVGVVDNLFDAEGLSLGLGGYLGFSRSKYKYSNFYGDGLEYGWNYTNLIIGGRGVLHYQFSDKLDTYTGLMLGANIVSSSSFGDYDDSWGNSASTSGLAYSYFIGARYYFAESFGVMAELGYGISYLNIGVCLKF